MESEYITWLKGKGVPLFEGGGTYWNLYNAALIPASLYPDYCELNSVEAGALLSKSGAWLIRYSSNPGNCDTSWWYVLCDRYDPSQISAKTRQNIRRGRRECIVQEVAAERLAIDGYACYSAAFGRYQGKKPLQEDAYREMMLDTIGGPFSYWGVFYQGHLAGYCQCVIDGNQVITNVTKYHPDYLRHRSAYALMDELIQTYVVRQNMVLSNGNRSIAHDTNYQEVLISLGFRKQFCRLNVVYDSLLKVGIDAIYPARSLLRSLPYNSFVQKVKALLEQEEIRRSFNAG